MTGRFFLIFSFKTLKIDFHYIFWFSERETSTYYENIIFDM